MVFQAIDEVFQPVADRVEALLDNPATETAEWANDMCRYLFILKSSLSGLAIGFWLEDQENKTGGKRVELWYVRRISSAVRRTPTLISS